MRSLLLCCSGLVVLGQAAAPAWAQSPAPLPGATGGTVQGGAGLEEVVVTAQRRSENTQKAGVPVSVVSNRALVAAGVTSPTQLGTVVPALNVEASGGANTLYFLRGVGNFTVNGYSDPAIAFNYDNVYINNPTETLGLIYDLARIEVLKGPQGTLYGRNATGGAINVIPERPRTGHNDGFLTVSYGNYDSVIAQGALNYAVAPQTALRISGSLVDHAGYLDDRTSDEKSRSGRVQLQTQLNDQLSLRIEGDGSYVGGDGGGAYYVNAFTFDPATGSYVVRPSGLHPSQGLLDPQSQAFRQSRYSPLAGRFTGPLSPSNFVNNDYWGTDAELKYTTDYGTLTVIPAYRGARQDVRFDVAAFDGYTRERDDQYSAEARWAGNRLGIFDYVLGGLYYRATVDGQNDFSQDALNAYQTFSTATDSYAFFGRLTAHITDKLRLIGGLRFTEDRKTFDGAADVVIAACVVQACPDNPVLPGTDTPQELPFPTIPNGVVPIGHTGAIAISNVTSVRQQISIGKVTQRAAAEYDIGPRSMAYASYESGYRSGGFSLSAGHETYAPEYIDAYTVGVKNRFFDNSLQLNIEGFLWKYRNQQVGHLGLDTRGVLGQFTENVGRSQNQGFEVESRYLLTDTTEVNADLQYLDTDYSSYAYKVPGGSNPPPYVGCPYAPNPDHSATYLVSCSGKPAYQAPRWTLNLGAQQTIPLKNASIVLEADTQYRTSRYVGFEFLPFEHIGSTWDTNAQATYAPAGERWLLSAFIQHIEGGRIPVSSNTFSLSGLSTLLNGPPRLFGVRLTAKF